MKTTYQKPLSSIVQLQPITRLLYNSKELGGGGIDDPLSLSPARKIYV